MWFCVNRYTKPYFTLQDSNDFYLYIIKFKMLYKNPHKFYFTENLKSLAQALKPSIFIFKFNKRDIKCVITILFNLK